MRTVAKPWGRELWWAETDRYVAKRLELAAGHATSLQLHRRKCETLYLLSGRLRLTVAGERFEIGVGEALTIQPGTVHRLEALTDAVVFEASTPEVDDVVRLADRYGRVPDAGAGDGQAVPAGGASPAPPVTLVPAGAGGSGDEP